MFSILEGKEKLAVFPKKNEVLRSLIGGTISIFFLLTLTKLTGHIYIMAPFGATCVILYAVSQSPLAQPRNVIFGHLISAFIGLFFLKFFSESNLTIALSVGCAIALMQVFKCVHPPAGANPLVILLTANSINYEWSFLVFPVLLGSIVLVLVAAIVNNIKNDNKWPLYGLGLIKTK
ncbi:MULTISPECIES: HPP family protein [unclassified Acinetobacter]|uniref:HPP family protein n=1 Tax=unclassified Acinetobacter TaxID=196816 RepID=UPI0029351D89|nr:MULTISPECIES: HPP family protein [unclassified Acinetobacter]WOE33249.1 HPP family protein [Acinetobacter sp. SAAs470]WOE36970.1 HPP family protein [Acinetobacter sp. SAAs474]